MKIALLAMTTIRLMAAFSYRENGPVILFPYPVAVVDEAAAFMTPNPANLPRQQSWALSTGYSHPYSLEGLEAGSVRAGFPFGDAGFQAVWSRFGIDEYREDIFEANAGYRLHRMLLVGAGVSHFRLGISADDLSEDHNLTDYRASLLAAPFSFIELSLLQENLRALFDSRRETMLSHDTCMGVGIFPARGISLTWNANRTYDGWINTFSAGANLLSWLSVKGGYSRETASYAASAIVAWKNISVSYGLRYHSYLGATHTFGATVAASPVSFQEVRYGTRPFRRSLPDLTEKIDISRCGPDDLKKLPGFDEPMTERVIRYRALFGPVSEKALLQLGLKSRDIEALTPLITGLASDEAPKEKRERAQRRTRTIRAGERPAGLPFAGTSKRRDLFQKLLGAGVPSLTALRLAEEMRSRQRADLRGLIEAESTLSHEIKQRAVESCRGL